MNMWEKLYKQALGYPLARERGWKVHSVLPKSMLRWDVRDGTSILQQEYLVKYDLPKPEWRTILGFVSEDMISMFLDVPVAEDE